MPPLTVFVHFLVYFSKTLHSCSINFCLHIEILGALSNINANYSSMLLLLLF